MNNNINLSELIDNGRWSIFQKYALVLCAIVIILDGVDILVIGLAAPDILRDWQITKSELAPAIAAGLFGMMLGATLGGIAGDRIGRRLALVASVFVFGGLTLAMLLANDVWTLGVLRFIAGLGLGGAFPNATALITEITPARRRALAVAIVMTCVSIGGVIVGTVGGSVLPEYGWRGLFLFAGLLPLAVGVVLALTLPESPQYLARNRNGWARLRLILNRMGNSIDDSSTFDSGHSSEGGIDAKPSLFSRDYIRDTMAIWAAFFFCLTATYLSFNWIPTLMAEIGHDLAATSYAVSFFNVGGIVASVVGGWLFAKLGSRITMSVFAFVGVAVTAFLIIVPGVLGVSSEAIPIFFAVQGASILGMQVLLYPLAGNIYPTAARSTGIGAAAGIGRIGAVVSASAGAALLSLNGAVSFFTAVLVCIFLASIAVIAISRQMVRVEAQATKTAAAESV